MDLLQMPRVPTTWRVCVLREAWDTPPCSLAGAAFGSERHRIFMAEPVVGHNLAHPHVLGDRRFPGEAGEEEVLARRLTPPREGRGTCMVFHLRRAYGVVPEGPRLGPDSQHPRYLKLVPR